MPEPNQQKEPKLIKVALCIPMAMQISGIFVKELLNLIYVVQKQYSNKYMLYVLPTINAPIDRARNDLVKAALELEVDLLFFLDADNLCVPQTIDILLNTMVEYKADLVTALYFQKSRPYVPTIRRYRHGGYFAIDNPKLNDVLEIDGAGLGCCLIKANVFKRLKYPWFRFSYEKHGMKDVQVSEDLYLCKEMMRAGMKMVCNTGLISAHIGSIADVEEYMAYLPLRTELVKDQDECIKDIVEFTGQDRTSVVHKTIVGPTLVRDEWNAKNPKKYSEIKQFYKETENYLYDLTHGHFTVRRIKDIELVVQMEKIKPKNILDFGCGIGQNAIMLARKGFDVTLADLKSKTLDFAEFRFRKHKLPYKIWYMDIEEMPPDKKYDAIISLDVLEHLPKHVFKEYTEKIVKLKHKNTKVIATVTFGKSKNYPMHMNADAETKGIIEKFINEYDESKED